MSDVSTLPTLVPAFGMPGGMEWLIILVVMLLIFGHKLPSIMRGLGGSIKEFKQGMNTEAEPPKPATPVAPEGAVAREAKPVASEPSKS